MGVEKPVGVEQASVCAWWASFVCSVAVTIGHYHCPELTLPWGAAWSQGSHGHLRMWGLTYDVSKNVFWIWNGESKQQRIIFLYSTNSTLYMCFIFSFLYVPNEENTYVLLIFIIAMYTMSVCLYISTQVEAIKRYCHSQNSFNLMLSQKSSYFVVIRAISKLKHKDKNF